LLNKNNSNVAGTLFKPAASEYNRTVKSILIRLSFLLIAAIESPMAADGQNSGKILEYNTFIRVENNNLIEEKSFYFEVDDKQSDWMSDIKIPYNKSSKLDIIEAEVLNSRGEIVRKLSKKEIVTRSDISENSFYEDDMAKEFSLRNNVYPYFVRYTYRRTTGKFINVALWTPLLSGESGTGKASLKVELPGDYKVKIWQSGNLDFKKDSSDGKYLFSWEAYNVIPVKKEVLAPPEENLIPKVYIVPGSFTYGIAGKTDSWKTIGLWHEEINRDMDILPLSEQVRVTSLLDGISDKLEKMKKLYHYMQDNTHYINVSIDIGGLQPYPASYVCNNKYGDCKALTMYMKALLKFAGIESFYTTINAGNNAERIIKDFPSFQFNHIILCVPNGKDTIWLENTSQTLPFGYLGPFTQNRYALVVNGSQSNLVRTPAMGLNDFQVSSFYRINPEISGRAVLHLERDFRGNDFINWLQISSEASEDERKEAVSDQLSLKNEVIKYELSHPLRDEPDIKLTADMKAENVLRNIGNSLVFVPFNVKLYPFEKPEIRKYPLRINFPVNRVDSIVVELSSMYNYDAELPAAVKIETKYGSYNVNFIKEEGRVIITRHFILLSNDYPREEYDAFYAFIDSVTRSMKKSAIILNKKI
jgi:predicted DNA binding CopG/RHH family protein